eukprot:m.308094 g.308094  ORF g.308094 m.308094 type:complete len:523 (+) comp15939_c2_seq7:268-1836(+)
MAFAVETLSQSQRRMLVREATELATSMGALVAPPKTHSSHGRAREFVAAPISLIPACTPRTTFEASVIAQPLVSQLVDTLARSPTYLKNALQHTAAVDPFTGRLYDMYIGIVTEFPAFYQNEVMLGVIRNDFMFHLDSPTAGPETATVRHVETNTIAASMGGLAASVAKVHRTLYGGKFKGLFDVSEMPKNAVLEGIVDSFKIALDEYESMLKVQSIGMTSSPTVVMVVKPQEFNAFDQRLLEACAFERHGIVFHRLTLKYIHDHGQVTDDNVLTVTCPLTGAPLHVGLLYFRAGYSPEDFPTEDEWSARELVERSKAVKCPNLPYHLAGTKKVQQLLAQPDVIEEFLSPEQSAAVRATFAGLYSLDETEYSDGKQGLQQVIDRVLANPQDFVLKPQREGGGSNFYGDDVATKLNELTEGERKAYIVQDIIRPPSHRTLLLNDTEDGEEAEVVNELGIFGTIVSRAGGTVVENVAVGHLLRGKRITSAEAGVAAGHGFIDAVYLCPCKAPTCANDCCEAGTL